MKIVIVTSCEKRDITDCDIGTITYCLSICEETLPVYLKERIRVECNMGKNVSRLIDRKTKTSTVSLHKDMVLFIVLDR
jgi:hypothetical protein